MSQFPLVSLIVPVYNREKEIRVLLSSVLNQSYKNIEIIVVDDGSVDNTPNVALEFTQKVYMRKHKERSVQRNYGAERTKGKYLFFPDSDMELTKNVVSDCVNAIEKDNTLGGIVIPEKSIAKTFWEEVKAFERSFYNESGDSVTDAARFFTRDAFEKVGGYDETITGPEDWDLPESIKEAGYKISRVKSRLLHYEKVPSLLSLIQKKYYYGLKSHGYIKKHKISLFSAKTVYFLRPIFYRRWRELVSHPILTLSMFTMFSFELLGGALGFFVGKYIKK
jgi:glycosyltransferase involved in cell wall biosynthesis